MIKIRKLNARGFSHHLIIAVIVLVVGVGGTYMLVRSHADNCPSTSGSTTSGSSVTTGPSSTTSGSTTSGSTTTCCPTSGSAVSGSAVSGSCTGSSTSGSTTGTVLTASCIIRAPASPMIRNTTYKASYTFTNTSNIPIGATLDELISGKENSTTWTGSTYSTVISLPTVLQPSQSYIGTIGAFDDSQTKSGPIVISLSGSVLASNGSASSLAGRFGCATTSSTVGLINSSTLISSDWILAKPSTVANDGSYRSIIKLSPSSTSSILDYKTNNFAIDNNGKAFQACITARAISSSNYSPITFAVHNANNNMVTVHPTFNSNYRKLCYDFYLSGYSGVVPSAPGKIYLEFFATAPGSTSFYIRSVTLNLI